MIFIISFLHTIFIGLIDALIKGNAIAIYNNDWQAVPWYWKDVNFIYPALVIGIFGLLLGILLMRKKKWGWKYLIMLAIWLASGLESLSYWFWIAALKINQTMSWLPDESFFWWYPKTAPWLNRLIHLKWLSDAPNVTRQAVLYGIILAFCINLVLIYLYEKTKEKSEIV